MRVSAFVMAMGMMAVLSGIAALGVADATSSVLPNAMQQVNATLERVNAGLTR